MPTDPATVPPLTMEEMDDLWAGVTHAFSCNKLDDYALGGVREGRNEVRDALRAAYALAASRVDTAEVERRAARKAWDAAHESTLAPRATWDIFRDAYLAREYPAPAPRECVLSDGSVVRCDDDRVEFTRYRPDHLPRVSKPEHWPLLVPDLTGADFEKLQAFVAAEVDQ